MPTAIVHAGDGSGRLFIALQGGQILIHDGTLLLPTPFLDISTLVSCCGERGLLGLAFHQQYTTNGLFYVYYTNTGGDVVIARYAVSGDPNRAEPTGTILLTIPHPSFANHNGGQLAFGPDGYLYIGVGDGGGAGDSANNAQNLGSLLGKILRIDVGVIPYAIPPTNPFVGISNARGEIWAYGLRNPWRFSFDRLTGDVFIGDVGQNAWEEIDFQSASSSGGANYGWRRMEGAHCFNPSSGCNDDTLVLPIIEYPHAVVGGNLVPDCSVTGGYRYRGPSVPELAGRYAFGDLCSGRMLAAAPSGTTWTVAELLDTPYVISTFGEDQSGELYVAHHDATDGAVYRVVPTIPRARRLHDFNGDGRGDLLWRNGSGLVEVWLTDGADGVLGQGAIGTASNDWAIQGVGDFNGDGRDDILWRHGSGIVHIWFLNGLSLIGSASVENVGRDWTIEAVGDFNGDGKADLLWRHLSGATYMWLMDGAAIAQGGSVGGPSPLWRIQDAGDFNGDGTAGILWRHSSGVTHVWLMHGLAIIGSGSPGSASNDWTVQRVQDFSGDGRADILWRHTSGATHVWLLNGIQILTTGSPGTAAPPWNIEAIGERASGVGGEVLWRDPGGQLHRWVIQNTSLVEQSTLGAVSTDWITY
jgi:Glucose / Sorbosone dehydrogenase/FG-GAP-like repeat